MRDRLGNFLLLWPGRAKRRLWADKRNTHLHIPNGGRGYGGAEPPHPQAGLHGGATAFHPLGLADAVRLVGGPNVLLALIADAQVIPSVFST